MILAAAAVAAAATFGDLSLCSDTVREGAAVYRVTLARHAGSTRFRGDAVTIPASGADGELRQTSATIFPSSPKELPAFMLGLRVAARAKAPAAPDLRVSLSIDGAEVGAGPAGVVDGRFVASFGDPSLEEIIEASRAAPYAEARGRYGRDAAATKEVLAALTAGKSAEASFSAGGRVLAAVRFPLADFQASLPKGTELGKRLRRSCR